MVFFFFSSRRRHTSFSRDWSSDVCSSDLGENVASVKVAELGYTDSNHRSLLVKIWAKDPDDIHTAAKSLIGPSFDFRHHRLTYARLSIRLKRSEERRVGKEGGARDAQQRM